MKYVSILLILLAVIGGIAIGAMWAGGNVRGKYTPNYDPKTTAICPYEGGECPNAQKHAREYQLETFEHGVKIFEADSLIGIARWGTRELDSLLFNDKK